RHTRWVSDWSSDVCSSDLDLSVRIDRGNRAPVERAAETVEEPPRPPLGGGRRRAVRAEEHPDRARADDGDLQEAGGPEGAESCRSEERRGGEEGRWGGARE